MDQADIYAHHADAYDRLVGAEDVDRNLMPAIEAATPVAGKTVLEVGAGTGRITRQLVARGARVIAFDRAPAMLDVARRHLAHAADRCSLAVASADALPIDDGIASLAVAGWVFGHFTKWMPDGWRDEVSRALAEMRRGVGQGGSLVIIETLGTGRTEPAPPNESLAAYYRFLVEEHGFTMQPIRTDYLFASVDEAASVTGFFFGERMASLVRERGSPRVPECTGVFRAPRS